MKTVMKRAATMAWVGSIVLFGAGTFCFLSAMAVRALTRPSVHARLTMIEGEILQGQEIRRPTLFEAINGAGIDPDFLAIVTGVSFVLVLLGGCVVPWWHVRRTPPDEKMDSGAMQELHRQGEQLSRRLESLETILLDRSRIPAELEREHL